MVCFKLHFVLASKLLPVFVVAVVMMEYKCYITIVGARMLKDSDFLCLSECLHHVCSILYLFSTQHNTEKIDHTA